VGASSLVRVLPSFVAACLQLTKASVNNTVVSNTVNLEKRFTKSSYDFIFFSRKYVGRFTLLTTSAATRHQPNIRLTCIATKAMSG
jgi:hypothetical protein